MEKDHNSDSTSLSDQEKEFAQLALNEFNKGTFGSCLQHILKLENLRPKDIKILHNKYVTEYYKSYLCKTDQFRKNIHVVCTQARIDMDNLEHLEDVEHCIIYYNQAVLYYHLKEHNAALKIMNKVFTFIEPMEESLAHRVCLLLIELHLCTFQPDRALALITYIENQFVSTENATKMTMSSASEKDIKPLEKEPRPLADLDAATDAFRLKLLQYKVRCYLCTCALKAAARELKIISETSHIHCLERSPSSSKSNTPGSVTPKHSLSSNGHSVTSSSEEQNSLPLVFLNANMEYMNKNYKEATNILSHIPKQDNADYSVYFRERGESPIVFFYNNMACIHHYMGKPKLSNFFFNKALQENMDFFKKFPAPDSNEPMSGRPLYLLANKNPQLKYNLGISLLHAQKPVPAFEYLTEAVQNFHTNPRLWLRLAECCIMAFKSGNNAEFNIEEKMKSIILKNIGSGIHKKLILNQAVFSNMKYSCESDSYAIPIASLEFASLCLRNALVLCSTPEQEMLPSVDSRNMGDLKCCILAASCFVSLTLGDPSLALNHASLLLAQPNVQPFHRFLGHLYTAESLVLLNKFNDAIDHLALEHLADNFPGEGSVHIRKWLPTSLPSAKNVLQYNLACAFALRGELDKSSDILNDLCSSRNSQSEVPIQVVTLRVYISLKLGQFDVAKSLIDRYSIIPSPIANAARVN